ncbi:MAG TPA: sigma-54 dependent transcriptional regulator [Gemmatimonadaceae bacterium]|jgi:DNA-binding NtrC family response regulator|nr:sigma-54 dependent transcriptional regulator [Gemmatimonadaceae bacterium]
MTVLITLNDVEPAVRVNKVLEADGIRTAVVSPLDDMRGTLKREQPAVIVFSGDLTDTQTLAVVRDQLWNGVSSVGLAATDDPVQLDRLRAAGFVELYRKPVDVDEVVAGVKRVLERRRLQQETGLMGESEPLREVLVKVEQMAPVSSTVLVEGESGTGKELVARALHRLSPRRNKAFIAVNVGALPETLLESELFGHEKGAFTGAAERRIGRVELAHGGTLFLDEIGDIPPATQVKLLRVLEDREVMRLGATQPIKVNVRVVAATNRALREQVEEGSFRGDLFYRLSVLNIYLPPLRARKSDIPYLVRQFIREFVGEHGREFVGISAEAMQLLVDYPWPGNVRELRNLVDSMVVLAPGREIEPDDLPRQIRDGGTARLLPVRVPGLPMGLGAGGSGPDPETEFIVRSLLELKLQVEELRHRLDGRAGRLVERGAGDWLGEVPGHADVGGMGAGFGGRGPAVSAIEAQGAAPPNEVVIPTGTKMAEVERRVIEAALRETRGNRRKAAEMLGIGERTLYRKIKEYKMPEMDYLP